MTARFFLYQRGMGGHRPHLRQSARVELRIYLSPSVVYKRRTFSAKGFINMYRRLPCLVILVCLWSAVSAWAQELRMESFQGQEVVAGEILVRFRGVSETQSRSTLALDNGVAFAEPVGSTGAMRVRSTSRNVTALLQAYQGRLDVLYAEPNYVWRKSDLPNDALFGQQWALRNTGQVIQGLTGTNGADIKAHQAWDITEGSRAFVIGIVDSGVDYNHPDLAANIWSAPSAFTVTVGGQTITCPAGSHGFNAILKTCDPMDDESHGTHVAGIAGGAGNNGLGVSGVARVASIMGLKFLGASGFGSTADAIDAIDFAIKVKAIFPSAANVRILNASWGGFFNSAALRDQISLTQNSDMLFVAAAGNDGLINDLIPRYPAGYDLPNILSVAATTNRDALASYSNWGPLTVNLAAPGDEILSTVPSGLYAYFSGTSMAAPTVSGAAALVLAACPLNTSQVRSNLMANVDILPALTGKMTTSGRLNVQRSVSSCAGALQPSFRLTVTPGSQTVAPGGTVNLGLSVTALNGFSGSVALAAVTPVGITASLAPSAIAGAGTGSLTLTAAANATPGAYLVQVIGVSGAQTVSTAVVLTIGPSVLLRQTITGTLTKSDQASTELPGSYADLYRLTLNAPTAVVIDLKSRIFDPYLYVLSSSGAVMYEDADSGGVGSSRVTATLGPGSYTIEVTSDEDDGLGAYSVSINTPTLVASSVSAALPGADITVTLTGTLFASPMTVNAGAGITVANVNVISPTQATAVFTVASDATAESRDLLVTTGEGTSNALPFLIPPAIAPGQRIEGALATTDSTSPVLTDDRLYRYSDLYRLTLSAATTVTIDVKSTDFDGFAEILSVSTGAVLFANDDSGGGDNPRITANLAAGSYFIEVTSYFRREVGNYSLSINLPTLTSISPGLRSVGTAGSVTLSGTGFVAPMTIDAGAGITVTGVSVASSTTATATFTIAPNASLGLRSVTATTPNGSTNAMPFRVIPTLPDISLGLTVTGNLATTDLPSLQVPGAYSDLYQLVITAATPISIDLRSNEFDAYLAVLSSVSGAVLAEDDDSGGNGNASILGTIFPGTYYIEVTSANPGATGAYTLITGRLALVSMTPSFGSSQLPVTVTFSGSGFRAPLTVNAGPGITVSNISVSGNGATATATLTIAAGATPGPRSITLTTPDGTTNPATFNVLSSLVALAPGDRILGSLGGSDQRAPLRPTSYGDMYLLTVQTAATLTIDMQSASIDSYLYVISPNGTTLFTDDQSGGNNNARIQKPFTVGTYYVLATTYEPEAGPYTLTVGGVAPTLTAVSPNTAARGTVVGVTLTGTALLPPISASGDGLSVTNVSFISSTTAIATVSVGANATIGPRPLTVTTPYGTATGGTFNVVAPQASLLNFPRLFSSSDLAGTGLALVNPSGTAAAVTFTLYSTTGTVVATKNETVPARGQFSRLGSELFSNPSQAGWIQASSPAVGLQSFWVGGDFTTFMDGAAAAPSARELVFPLVTGQTELNVANPGTGVNSVTFRVYGPLGTEIAGAVTQNVAANGIYSVRTSTLFPSLNLDGVTASIRVTGSANITGSSVTTDFAVAPSWTVINGIDASLSLLQVNFPHVPSGSQGGGPAWTSVLGITNISPEAQNVTLTFTPNSGAPVQVVRSIPGRGTVRLSVQTEFGFSSAYQEGWVRVSGPAPLNGFIAYGFAGSSGAAVVPSQGIAQSTLLFSHVANGPGWGTGLALLNSSAVDAEVRVYIMNPDGSLIGGADNVPTAAFTLPAGAKTARLLTELVPTANSNGGFVFVRTTNNVPLFGLELFFTSDARVIANVSAGAVDPSITYTPPAP